MQRKTKVFLGVSAVTTPLRKKVAKVAKVAHAENVANVANVAHGF